MDIEVFFEEGKRVNAKVGNHVIKTDQPEKAGGDDSAPAPFSLFLASLATCAGIYVKSFCDQRGIDSSKVKLTQKHHYNQEKRMVGKIEINVELPDDFPEKYKKSLSKVIDQCAVKKHIKDAPEFEVNV